MLRGYPDPEPTLFITAALAYICECLARWHPTNEPPPEDCGAEWVCDAAELLARRDAPDEEPELDAENGFGAFHRFMRETEGN